MVMDGRVAIMIDSLGVKVENTNSWWTQDFVVLIMRKPAPLNQHVAT